MQKTSLFEFLTEAIPSFYKYKKTRPHTDGFRRNNAKCLKSNGICNVVPYSSFSGF